MQPRNEPFEQAWPELARRLERVLRSRSVSPWLVDDIVQETGLRLFKRWDTVDPQLSPWGLTLTIANHLLWDATHRHASRELLIEIPDRAASQNVENAGIARLELWRVARAIGRMSPRYRSVLLAEVGGEETSARTAAATKMTRMRARRRLNALLEEASAGCLTAIGTVRRWVFDLQHFARRAMPLFEGSASVTVAAVVGTVVVMAPASAGPWQTDASLSVIQAPKMQRADVAAAVSPSSGSEQRQSLRVASSPGAKRHDAARDSTRHDVTVGKSVGGSAGVEIRRKKKRRDVFRPECSVDPREDEVHAKCTIHTRDNAYIVEARVRAQTGPES